MDPHILSRKSQRPFFLPGWRLLTYSFNAIRGIPIRPFASFGRCVLRDELIKTNEIFVTPCKRKNHDSISVKEQEWLDSAADLSAEWLSLILSDPHIYIKNSLNFQYYIQDTIYSSTYRNENKTNISFQNLKWKTQRTSSLPITFTYITLYIPRSSQLLVRGSN